MTERTIELELKEQFSKFMESRDNYEKWDIRRKVYACICYISDFNEVYSDSTLNEEEFTEIAKEHFGLNFSANIYNEVNMLVRVKEVVTEYIISLIKEI